MTDDDLKTRTNDFVHALAASDADVANITAEKSEQGMRVTLDLLDPDDTNLVCEVGGVIEDFPHLHRYRSLQTNAVLHRTVTYSESVRSCLLNIERAFSTGTTFDQE
jgi:hypothetical protein